MKYNIAWCTVELQPRAFKFDGRAHLRRGAVDFQDQSKLHAIYHEHVVFYMFNINARHGRT